MHTGGWGQEAYFQGKLYGEGDYYQRYPATPFFHISDDDEDAIKIIMRPP